MRIWKSGSILATLCLTAPAIAQTIAPAPLAAPAVAEAGLARLDGDQRAIAWDGSVWTRVGAVHLKQRIYDDGNRGLRLDTAHFHTQKNNGVPRWTLPSRLSAMTATASAWQDVGQSDRLVATLSASRSRRLSAIAPFPNAGVTSYTRLAQIGWQHGDRSTVSLGWFATGADLGSVQDSMARLLAGEPLAAKGVRLGFDMPLDGTAETAKTRFSFDIRRETLEAFESSARSRTARIGFSFTQSF